MTVVTQLLIAAAAVFFAWILILAFIEAVRAGQGAPDRTFDDSLLRGLLEEKHVALASIKATELDHETGKISDEDFERLRDEGMERAIALMREIDEMRSGFRYDSQVEKDLKNLGHEVASLSPTTTTPLSATDGELIVLDMQASGDPAAMSEARRIRLARRGERTEANEPARRQPARSEPAHPEPALREPAAAQATHARSCPSCSSPINEDDKFCSECGASLRATCPSCGARQRMGAKFCSECGTSLTVRREAKA